MSVWIWIVLFLIVVGALLSGFIIIARKGRELRKKQPLPPPAEKAFLQWTHNDKQHRQEIEVPFYFGKHTDSNVVLAHSRADYEVCIFYHSDRFAIQTLPGAPEFLINGKESVASYLWDGDELTIAGRKFIFHCY